MVIAHILNPVLVDKSSDLYEAQPVTFRTLVKAKRFSGQKAIINQYTVSYKEDAVFIDDSFIKLPDLKRSVLDIKTFSEQRKLPLIKDILNALNAIKADYVIYTNVDIAVLPFFYDYIVERIENGADSFIINRRVIKKIDKDVLMYAEIGDSHPGYDCFVFRKELITKFIFNSTCIGANWIGRIFYANLLVHSKHLEIIKDAHLTFHIGDDGAWLNHSYSDFDAFNKLEVYNSIHQLIEVTTDKTKLTKLEGVLTFMDSWGSAPKKTNTNLITRIKKKLKQHLLCLLS